MTDKTVAKTILSQLGGPRFAIMTGAKNFMSDKKTLYFSIPRAKGVNRIAVTLTPEDLYDMEFSYFHGGKLTVKNTVRGVYNDQLESIFTTETGLYTRL